MKPLDDRCDDFEDARVRGRLERKVDRNEYDAFCNGVEGSRSDHVQEEGSRQYESRSQETNQLA